MKYLVIFVKIMIVVLLVCMNLSSNVTSSNPLVPLKILEPGVIRVMWQFQVGCVVSYDRLLIKTYKVQERECRVSNKLFLR